MNSFFKYFFVSKEFLVKEFKKFEFKSLPHNSQYSCSENYEVFSIDLPKLIDKSQYQFDEDNNQINVKMYDANNT